jgi:hypothetical protein
MRAARSAGQICVFVLCVASFGCKRPAMSAELRHFFSLSYKDQQAAFESLGFDEQIEVAALYYNAEPRTDWFAIDIASRPKVLPLLVERFRQEKNDERLELLTYILQYMAARSTDVAVYPGLLDTLDRKERSMKEGFLRSRVQSWIAQIRFSHDGWTKGRGKTR